MLNRLYAKWMYSWETRLTMRDENRVVRPLEWGFDWLRPFLEETGLTERVARLEAAGQGEAAMVEVNEAILADSDRFYAYERQGIDVGPSAKAANFTMNRRAIRDLAANRRRGPIAAWVWCSLLAMLVLM